ISFGETAGQNKDTNGDRTSNIINNQEGLTMLNIVLDENWEIDQREQIVYHFIDDKGENRGSVSAIHYIDSFNLLTQLPNHSSVINDEYMDTSMGQTRLITLDS